MKGNRILKRSEISVLLLFILVIMLAIGTNFWMVTGTVKDSSMKNQDYRPHLPILIDGDNDLRVQASKEGWDLDGIRDGTKNKPFVISGISITGYNGIEHLAIWNTTLFLEIQDNVFEEGMYGIYLDLVENIQISNNRFIRNHQIGLHLSGDNCNITDNIFTDNFGGAITGYGINNLISTNIISDDLNYYSTGISSYFSNSAIINNDISGQYWGIDTSGLMDVTLSNNRIHHNIIGFNCESFLASYSSYIRNNLFYENELCGIKVSTDAENYYFENNTIFNNYYGIILDNHCRNIMILENNISNHVSYGIYINSSSSRITVSKNIFNNNGISSNSQAYDSGDLNIFEMNFWDDWTTPDNNSDGYVDLQYQIDGGDNFDNKPRCYPFEYTLSSGITSVSTQTSSKISGITSQFLLVLFPILILSKRKRK